MEDLIKFLKCIADETRFKMLKLILGRTLCVCELTAILEKTQPCISQHLNRFKELGLVVEEKKEQWSYYRINEDVLNSFLQKFSNLSGMSFCELGMEDLEKRLRVVKDKDLCNTGKSCSRK